MSRFATAGLSLAVAIVLADSAVVTLALPDILRELDAEVSEVAWVLTAFNLVLALAAVPAARICVRADSAVAGAIGVVAFAAASAVCALAPSLEVLIGARVAQAIGGAFVIVACLEPLGARRWAAAGVTGAALGPVAGGLLTEALSWQSIFWLQVPTVLVAVGILLGLRGRRAPVPETPDRPHLAANAALALLSAALTAALFLLVLMLVEGWRRSPGVAALTVTVIPLAALAAAPLARTLNQPSEKCLAPSFRGESVAGCLLMAGGLIALAIPPGAELGWTLGPQVLVGLGLGLTVDSLTHVALRERVPQALHGGWTIAARHAGVVIGLAVLVPVFTSDLAAAQAPAEEAVAALVLDAPLPVSTKLALAEGLGEQLDAEEGRVPDLSPAFDGLDLTGLQRIAAIRLERSLDDQLERAATRAFRDAFLVAAALALLALLPALALRP